MQEKDLILEKEKDRTFYDCAISNENKQAIIALVGLCPGYTQLNYAIEHQHSGFDVARREASFKGCSKNIARMLRKIGVDKKLKIVIPDDYDFNASTYFFTTSLVKYPGLRSGKGRSDDFNPLDYEFAKKCIRKKFLKEMVDSRLNEVVIFGKKAEASIKEYVVDGRSIERIMIDAGKKMIYLPHPSGSNNGGVAKFLRS